MEHIWIAYRRLEPRDSIIGWAYSAADAYQKVRKIIKADKPEELDEFDQSFCLSSEIFCSESYGVREETNYLENF